MRGDRRYLESATVTLASLNIEVVSVPANMTHFLQPLDFTVNREAKKFIKDPFTSWCSAQIQSQLDSGMVLNDVDVDLRLSVLKPEFKEPGSLACTTIFLALKADIQLQKDGRRLA